MTIREFFGSYSGGAALLIGLALGWLWKVEQKRKLRSKGIGIDTSDPLWVAALEKARATIPSFIDLAKVNPGSSFVKFALHTTTGDTEHVWGPVLALGEGVVTTGLESQPVFGRPVSSPPYELKYDDIEDWRVELRDGKIRGAFTAKAQFEYARKCGLKIPSEHLEVEKNLVDA